MDIFEYLRTAFHVVKAFATQDKIFYLGLGVLGAFIIWTVLSLVFSHELKCARVWHKIKKIIPPSGEITTEMYFAFTAQLKKLPTAVGRNWKKYENQKTGKPSDYITQTDMLDSPLSGGVHKQNRSIMKFAIWFVSFFFFLLSFASLGGEEVLTAKIITESLIIPFVLFALYRLNYYIYTAIRQNIYHLTVDDFQDLVDYLDQRIDINEIFDGKENLLVLNSNVYENSITQTEKPAERIVEDLPKVEKPQDQTPNVAQKEFYRNKSGKVEIRNQKEFSEALVVVEQLLDDGEADPKTKDEKTKKVAELMEAMTKYRNKNIK